MASATHALYTSPFSTTKEPLMGKINIPSELGPMVLTRGPKIQIAYLLTLLDPAAIRSNGPLEVMTRVVAAEDHHIIPTSKIRHAKREAAEIAQRSLGIGLNCSAQNYCSACPADWIFGTIGGVGANSKAWGFRSRIEMTEAIALESVPSIMRTINSVDPRTLRTGSSGLSTMFLVPAGTVFYGTINVEAEHEDLVNIVIASLLSITRVGAGKTGRGAAEVKIIAMRKGFTEFASWAPSRVVASGVLPRGTMPLDFPGVEDEGFEERFLTSIRNLNDKLVQPVVNIFQKTFNGSSPDVRTLETLAKIETGETDPKAFLSAFAAAKKARKDAGDNEAMAMLNAIDKLFAKAKKADNLIDVIKAEAENLRVALAMSADAVASDEDDTAVED